MFHYRLGILSGVAALSLGHGASAENFEYTVGATVFEGYIARPTQEALGTVLIIHDWDGVSAHERTRADTLAENGYVAIALDLFGRDAVLEGFEDYRRETGALYADRAMFRDRISASVDAALALQDVPSGAVLAGYCFGGAAVLEGARAGLNLTGFVSFHGGLQTPEGQDYSATSAPVLVLHGSADPVPGSGMGDLARLMDELQAAGVPHDARIFGGARHSFTVEGSNDWNPEANAGAEAAFIEFLDARF